MIGFTQRKVFTRARNHLEFRVSGLRITPFAVYADKGFRVWDLHGSEVIPAWFRIYPFQGVLWLLLARFSVCTG